MAFVCEVDWLESQSFLSGFIFAFNLLLRCLYLSVRMDYNTAPLAAVCVGQSSFHQWTICLAQMSVLLPHQRTAFFDGPTVEPPGIGMLEL